MITNTEIVARQNAKVRIARLDAKRAAVGFLLPHEMTQRFHAKQTIARYDAKLARLMGAN
jgi:Arc/MetJ family transcription regulator